LTTLILVLVVAVAAWSKLRFVAREGYDAPLAGRRVFHAQGRPPCPRSRSHPRLPAAADGPDYLPLLLITSAATLALIGIATLVRAERLRTGGTVVVRESGGVDVGADPQDPGAPVPVQCLVGDGPGRRRTGPGGLCTGA